MVLGCSNTYQQLVTALKVDEIRWVLSKRGDSKVGTNSPWAINHKRDGKAKAWLAWLLLIGTSLVSLIFSMFRTCMLCAKPVQAWAIREAIETLCNPYDNFRSVVLLKNMFHS